MGVFSPPEVLRGQARKGDPMKEITFQEAGARVGEALATVLDRRRLFDALNALALLDENQEETTLSELALEWRRRACGR